MAARPQVQPVPEHFPQAVLEERLQQARVENDYRVGAALSSIYSKVKNYRSDIIRAVEEIKDNYLAQVIIDQIAEDALTPDVESGEVVTVTSKNSEVKKRIDELDKRFGFDRLIHDIKRDLLAYGEYTLSTVVDGPKGGNQKDRDELEDPAKPVKDLDTRVTDREGRPLSLRQQAVNRNGDKNGSGSNGKRNSKPRGLVEIRDDVDQERVIAISQNGEVTGYLTIENSPRQQAIILPPHRFVKFTLNGAKMRVKLHDDPILRNLSKRQAFHDKVPKFIRTGRSILYPILSKLKELHLLEQLVPATKLAKLSSGTIVGMRVEGGYDVKKAFDAARTAENLMNKKVGVDTTSNQLNIENIMNTVGSIKVVPVFGEKGALERFDYKPQEPDDLLASITDIRKTILSAAGIPYELVYGGEVAQEGRKGEILKRYARYLRRLKTIQTSMADGLRQIIEIHLVNTGTSYDPEKDIEIEFRNKLIQVDLLDELEFLDATVSMLGRVTQFLGVREEEMKKLLNAKNLVEFLNSKLSMLGLEKVIDPAKASELEDDEEEEVPGGFDTGGRPPNMGAQPPEPEQPPPDQPGANGAGGQDQ